MSHAATIEFQGDPDIINPDVEGLDATFDGLISDIPQSLIQAPDDFALDPELSKNPLKLLKEIRDRSGYVVRGDNGVYGGVPLANNFGFDYSIPHFAVLGVVEQDEMVKDETDFGNEGAYGMLGDAQQLAHGEKKGTIPTVEDGDEHDEIRAFYDTFLNQNVMVKRSQTLIRPICEWLIERAIDRLKKGDDVCVARDIALPLTYKAMSTMLGVPQERLLDFVQLGEKLFSAGVNMEQGLQAGNDLYDFFYAQAQDRAANPQRDAMTYFVTAKKDGKRVFTDEEAAISARFVLPAGIETTWRGLALVIATLLSHPDQYDDVCQDPKLVRRAVEEGFRHSPSGFVTPRLAKKDLIVGGVEIPAGSHITIYQGMTNRDPRRWEDPDKFDIHRKFSPHRTFNAGVHACAGQHLARLEVLTTLEIFAELVPNLKLAIPPEHVEVRGLQVRTPLHVPVRLS